MIRGLSESILADPVTAITAVAALIGMLVGFVSISNSIRATRRQQKEDLEKGNREAETRLKEHFDLKLASLDGKIDDVKDNHQHLERFMSGWIQRMEDRANGKKA